MVLIEEVCCPSRASNVKPNMQSNTKVTEKGVDCPGSSPTVWNPTLNDFVLPEDYSSGQIKA